LVAILVADEIEGELLALAERFSPRVW